MACLASRPIVDGIEREFENSIHVIHLNVRDPAVRTFEQRYRFQFTPTFVFLDGEGKEVWRSVGVLNPDKVRNSLSAQ
jgi:thioredoxin-related protein